MSHENPGAYHEARERIREREEREKQLRVAVMENFEKSKETVHTKKRLDVFALRQYIKTGRSLDVLKSDMKNALDLGMISRDTYDRILDEAHQDTEALRQSSIDPRQIPFGSTEFAQFLENSPLGKSIGTDIIGFSYGFFVQGSAILVILLWKILVDTLFLPRDIIRSARLPSSHI